MLSLPVCRVRALVCVPCVFVCVEVWILFKCGYILYMLLVFCIQDTIKIVLWYCVLI